MVCFLKVCCPCFFRRRRAGSSHGGSSVSDRPSSERRLGNRQPEAQEGGEPQQELELPNRDAAEQPEAPRIGTQPDEVITSFPRLNESPDGDNPSNDVSRQDPPQRDTGIAPRANDTQTIIGGPSNNVSQQGAPQHGTPKPLSRQKSRSTAPVPCIPLTIRNLIESTPSSLAITPQASRTQTNVSNPSNNVSQQGAPQHGTPKPRSRQKSRSTAPVPCVPLTIRDLMERTPSSSASAPQASGTQKNISSPSNDVYQNDTPMPGSSLGSHSTTTGPFPEYEDPMGGNQDTGSPSDGAPQANDTQTNTESPSNDVESPSSSSDDSESSRSSSYSDHQANGCKPPDDEGGNTGSSDGAPQVMNTQTNVSNPSDNISQQVALKQGAPKLRRRRGSRSITAGSLTTGTDLLGGFLDRVSGSSDGDPQANNTQTKRAQNSSGSQRGPYPIISERERELLGFMNKFR